MPGGSHYLYEATVGAGLPIIQTLRDLRETGDRIQRIEGVLSGTLSYLFNVWDGQKPFSALVREAKAQGFTEPDPRDDLSGTDVARKLIILAREMGLDLELGDVELEGLVPESLRSGDAAEFLERVPQVDEAMRERFEAARARGHVLRYVGRLDADTRRAPPSVSSSSNCRTSSPTSASPTTSSASPRAATIAIRWSCAAPAPARR